MIYLTFYITNFILLTALAFFRHDKKLSEFLFLLVFILLTTFAGVRGDVGQDTYGYFYLYGLADNFFNLRIEPVFSSLIYVHRLIIDDITSFYFTIALIQSIILFKATKKLHSAALFLTVYLASYYLNFYFNALRAGLALNLFLLSLSLSNKSKSAVFLFLSIGSHLSILYFLPVYFFLKNVKVRYLSVYFVLVLVLVIFFYDYLSDKLAGYKIVSGLVIFDRVSPVSILLLVLGLTIFSVSGRVSKKELFIYTYICGTMLLSGAVDIFYRLNHMGFIIFFFIFCSRYRFNFKRKLAIKPFPVLAVILLLWVVPRIWIGVLNEEAIILESGRGSVDFTYIPYTFFYESKYR